MKRAIKAVATGLLGLSSLLGTTGDARADVFYLGHDAAQNRIEFCNHTAGTVTVINGGASLVANQFLNLTGGGDSVKVFRVIDQATNCGEYDPINFNGFTVHIDGLAGNDVMMGGNGLTVLQGGTGDDDLTLYANGGADGGTDDDCLATNFAGAGGSLTGGSNEDCLDQVHAGSGAATVFNCGGETDDYHKAAATAGSSTCENAVAACGCTTF